MQSPDTQAPEYPPYFLYWGKAKPSADSTAAMHLLPYHCLDVAATGVEYLRRAPAFRLALMRMLHISDPDVLERWTGFWLAMHDLGKFAEAFQGQCPDVFSALRHRAPHPGKIYSVRHDSLGMLLWKQKLSDRAISEAWFGVDTEAYEDGLHWWVRSVTGHHGQPPHEARELWSNHFNAQEDLAAAHAFATDARALLLSAAAADLPSALGSEHFEEASKRLSWWLAGLAVLADWIGSNTEYFAYHDLPCALAGYWQHAQAQARTALDAVGVLPMDSQGTLPFAELFPQIAVASPLQDWATKVAIGEHPQIHLLEDVTGAGKTEAAVTLAHRLIAHGCADGFFIGLPTMATANAMYGRIAQVYQKLFEGQASLALAHGQRELVEAFASSIVPSGAAEDDARQADDTATARCTAWLADHNKRALLAPAGVGTIDQALLAVLHSKHQSLRLLGLFRKVLVVDEVHACDAYMQGVLEVLLEFHARAGGSAILLSATLPLRMKQALLRAFAKGVGDEASLPHTEGYPLVTSWSAGMADQLTESPVATRDDVRRTVGTHYASSQDEVIAAIDSALTQGRCVCWMRNTVADALAAYEIFRTRMPAEKLTLFHARFALKDRLEAEGAVLSHFGKDSAPAQRAGRLVIATQVAEQSLDADWDFVVSDLAPIDRLIQRAGRLQRHLRDAQGACLQGGSVRDERGGPVLWVFGPAWTPEPSATWFKAMFPKASSVYAHHGQLWLTAKLLQEGRFTMPDDARRLIEAVFGDESDIPTGLQRSANNAEGQAFGDASQAQQNTVKLSHGYVRGGIDWWSEAKTPSRLGEASVGILLARWDGDRLRPWSLHADPRHAWAYSTVRVAERLIAKAAEPSTPERRAELARVQESLPNQGKWSVLLTLEETPQGWAGAAWTAARAHRAEECLMWHYDSQMGLRQLNTDAREDE